MRYAYRYGTADLLAMRQQMLNAERWAWEYFELTRQEVDCWRMYGYVCEWVLDELVIINVN